MMDTENQWSEALASNNVRAIICWLRKLTAEGEADVEQTLLTFSCWVQKTSELAKKELLTLCFSHCQGLWMFLDRSSFTRVHVLLQRLRNLLTLAHWARKQLSSAHLWHGVGVPCMVCRDTVGSSDLRHGCWNREHRALKKHIWLGRLIQWWGIMGLLPKYPEAHEVKRISQMWKEMGDSHHKAFLDTLGLEEGETGRFCSLIQGMVIQLDRQHGCIWTSEDCTDQCYPPPNLQALLKLLLVPHIDNMSVQALLMYFVLDMANFLKCKDDLLQSFCLAFTIPPCFSQQIRAFWMLDHGHIKQP
uniref:protein ELYS-like n=1 Tax=Scatophagus argus TaxID=75038 RepID=UPI001ED81D68|nr:protein ELYS-like [Scatophagus argus]